MHGKQRSRLHSWLALTAKFATRHGKIAHITPRQAVWLYIYLNKLTHTLSHPHTHMAHFLASSQLREFSRKCSRNAQEFSLRNQLKQNAVALIFQICSFWLFSLLYFWLFFVCGFHADKLSANTFGFCVMEFLVISTWSLRLALSHITQSVDCFLLLFL